MDPDKSVDSYLVDQWDTSDGLPSNTINAIVQTPEGYMWLASSNGLVRFDGIKFSTIPIVGQDELSPQVTPEPFTLLVNREGNLWIASNIGIIRFRNQQFITYTSRDGLSENRIRYIYEDMRGNVWVSFMSGYVDRFSNEKVTSFNASHGLEGKKINAIVEDRNGNLLFATRENGIFSFREGRFSRQPVAGLDELHIITMYQDHKENLWIGTNKGLLRVGEEGTIKYDSRHGLSNDYIMVITEDSERNLWVGTLNGLNRLKRKPDGTIGFESLLKSITIFSLFEGRENSLWIGTGNSGLKRLKDSKFTSFTAPKALQEEIIISIYRDREGDTWMGSLGGKLFLFREHRLMETFESPGFTSAGILAIARDSEGNLWLGTMGKGVFQMKNRTFVQFTTREGLADNLVTSIYRDIQGNLWIGTFAGVSVLSHDGTIKSFISRDGLSGKVVNNIYEDRSQNIWIAADHGITFLEQGKITMPNIKYYLKGIPTVSIYEDPSPAKGEGPVFWISTDGAGLIRLRLKDGKPYSYTVEHGMVTNSIYQFFEEQGNFWLMSSSGILRVSKKELNLLAKAGTGRINCTSFGKAEGMQSTEFHSELSRHSGQQTRDGELWFITKKGISILNPKKIRVNKTPPPVKIEEVFFDGQSIPMDQDAASYTFKGNGDFIFHFTAITFLSPGEIKFKYQLEGFDREWIFLPASMERVAGYQNLAPGTYTFRVIACNADGVWNPIGDSIRFTLKAYFYQTIFFKVSLILMSIALVFTAVNIYKKHFFKPSIPSKENYLRLIVIQFLKSSGELLKLDIHKISRARDLVERRRSLKKILKLLSIPIYRVEKTHDFLKNSTSTARCQYLMQLLEADCQPVYEAWGSAFKLILKEDFILNMNQCFLVFPPEDMPAVEILKQLKRIEGANYQVSLVISNNDQQQAELRKTTNDTTNLLVTAGSMELINLLLSSSPLETFAKLISSQVKITKISPYQTTSGVNKESIFFGREKLLAHILQRKPSNYILVGGRQIGKSSLLKAIDRRCKNDSSIECHYLVMDAKPNITSKLAAAMKLPEDIDLKQLITHMGKIKKGKRRIFLIDEADKFIIKEVKTGYVTLHHFRSLSEEGRYCFILAGFWDLFYAAAFDYHSPLKNFGEILTVEDLEPEACHQLATKPMSFLNISYESNELIEKLLHETGRRANLIAIACDEILKNFDMKKRVILSEDLETALTGNTMIRAFKGWGKLSSDVEASRLDRIIVYATIGKESFTQTELMHILKNHKCRFEPEQIKESLARLELAFILKREKLSYNYRVPIFKKIILEQDPGALLEGELDAQYRS